MKEFLWGVVTTVLALVLYVLGRRADPGDISRWKYERKTSDDLMQQETTAAEDRRRKHEELKRRLDALKSRMPKPPTMVVVILALALLLPGVARAADPLADLEEAVTIAEQYQQLYLAAEEANQRLMEEIARLQQIVDEQQKMIDNLRRPRLAPWVGVMWTPAGPGVAVGVSF